AETAKTIVERQFVEVIIAPTISSEAIKIIASKAGIRLLEAGVRQDNIQRLNMKRVSGGLLLQDNDQGVISRDNLEVVTKRSPSAEEFDDLIFAWHVVKYVKSNAIVYARNKKTIGIGAGQMSRVYSARIAAIKAKDEKLKI
ncbi:MAG TPA: bifunctional phosphoribosylaminoimidazolecarboxamide formyltransferase/inosine monophosphate cyclohydrolase, partial [Gammaproteobacteria bacterium]|nr:bifunctional phosphoribosylaminoimidazolecarboxamide formyltransferase/inosine monophosphate cyclohydrolase [Gammaproteobacteria bacterium]